MNEIEQLKKERNDYKQRYESAEKRYEQLVQSSCEALAKKGKEMQEEIAKASELKAETIKLARKETAREIFEKLRDYKKSFYVNFSLMEEYEFNGILDDVEKQYGVDNDGKD